MPSMLRLALKQPELLAWNWELNQHVREISFKGANTAPTRIDNLALKSALH